MGWDLNPICLLSLEEEERRRHTYTDEEGHVKTGVREPQAKGRHELPVTTRQFGRDKEGFSTQLSERSRPCEHLDFRLPASRTGRGSCSVVLSMG